MRPSSLAMVRTWPRATAAAASTGSGSMRLGAGGRAGDSKRPSAFAWIASEGGVPGGEGSPTSVNSNPKMTLPAAFMAAAMRLVVRGLALEGAEGEVEADDVGARGRRGAR